jgi:hypothetical protein
VGCCGHVVPGLSVACCRRLFLTEPCCFPHCVGTELKKQVVRPVSNSFQVRECVEEVSSHGGSPIEDTVL